VVTADVQERAQQAGPTPVLLVDVRAAARMLGLGRCTVLALADSGELTRLRFGRAVRFAVGDIEAVVERRRSAGEVAPHQGAGPVGPDC
jgi:excisionase family DNA binding protein